MADDITSFLASSPVFSEMPPEQLEEMAPLFRRERHPAGAKVLRQGSHSDAVYFVRSGQLAVRIERGGWRETIAYLQPPDIFGELSFVTGRPCVADVEVLVDAEVLVLPREVIPKLPQEGDTILPSLTKVIAGRLQQTVTRGTKVRETPVVLLLNSPRWEAPHSFAWELGRSLARQSRRRTVVANLGAVEDRPPREMEDKFCVCDLPSATAGENLRSVVAEKLTDWQRRFENIILNPVGRDSARVTASTERFANWTGFLLGPGDVVPAELGPKRFVVQSAANPTLPILSGNCQIICNASEAEAEHQAGRSVNARFLRTVDSLARCIAGLQVGLALGGGGAWGWAHIGVIDELEKSGIPIDVVSGCSMGSVIGGFYCAGMSVEKLEELARTYSSKPRKFLSLRFWNKCLINEKKVRKTFRKELGDREVNRTEIPYWANAVDIRTGEEFAIRTGTLVDCLLASIALPGLLPPASLESHLLVDAGIMNPVPVRLVKAMGCRFAIGVNAMAKLPPEESSHRAIEFWEVLTRSMFLMGHEIGQARAEAEQVASVVFTPSLDNISMLQFSRYEKIIECGRQAAKDHLPMILGGYERLKSSVPSSEPALAPAYSQEG